MAKTRRAPKTPRPDRPPAPPPGGDLAPSTPARPGWLHRLALVALGVALAVGLLAALEGVLRLAGAGEDLLYDDPFVGFAPGSELFARQRLPDGSEVYATRPEKLAFFNPQRFAARKPAGGYRVFALGGSTTFGRPYDDRVSFARWLERYLDAADPSRRWEVVNAGGVSYASYRVVLLMRELVRYQPDLFVVYTGHNEFLEERSYGDLVHQNPLLGRLRMDLSRLRFAALARQVWRRAEGPPAKPAGTLAPEVATRLDGWTGLAAYHRDETLEAAVVEHFTYNLEQMVHLARDHGAAIVFVEPVENLKDFSPFKSQHADGLPPADRRRAEELLERGEQRLAAGDPAAALPALEASRDLDPAYAETRFRLGRALLALGRTEEARAAFEQARDLDVAPLRALGALHRAVRRVAGRLDVPLVDLPALLAADDRRRGGSGIPGDELLLDHVHPDIPVHSLIARRVLDLLAADGVVHPAPGWGEERAAAIYRRVVGSLDRQDYARRDLNLAKVLGWAGKLEEAERPLVRAAAVLPDDAEVQLNLGVLYQRTGRPAPALAALDRAAALAPERPSVHFNRGVVLTQLGRTDAAIAELEQALRLRPDYPEAEHDLGVLYRQRGDLDKAAAALRAALAAHPDAPEVQRNLALVDRDRGRFREAVAGFRRLLAAHPDDTAARTALGVTLASMGRLDDAAAELERAAAAAGSGAEPLYNLGLVYARQGRGADAEATYRRALERRPDHPDALNNLGILLASRGELDEARELLARAVAAAPDNADAVFNLGVAEDNAGHPDEALRRIRRAVELAPDNGRFHYALGALYAARGDLARARTHLERATALGQAVPPELLARVRAGG